MGSTPVMESVGSSQNVGERGTVLGSLREGCYWSILDAPDFGDSRLALGVNAIGPY